METVVVGYGEDRAPYPVRLGGHDIILKLSGQDTGGNFSAAILRAQPMSGPPLHLHSREDEWFYVLRGEFTFQVGEERFTAGEGTSVFAPRDVPHTWQNFADTVAEALAIAAPSQIEDYFLEAARQLEPEAIAELNERYGIAVLGPPLD